MRQEKNRTTSVKNRIVIVLVVFLFLVLIMASIFGSKGWLEVYNAKKKKMALLDEIDRLEKKKNQLEREIMELESNPKSYEHKARDQLGLIYPDEVLIVTGERKDEEKKSSSGEKK
jgi:cell division protein FtsB